MLKKFFMLVIIWVRIERDQILFFKRQMVVSMT